MSNTVIRVENISKQYRLDTLNHGTLYRDLQSWWAKKREIDAKFDEIEKIPGYACEALFKRHVRAAGVRGGGAS